MKPPRGLSAEEASLWQKVAETVTPLHPARPTLGHGLGQGIGNAIGAADHLHPPPQHAPAVRLANGRSAKGRVPPPPVPSPPAPPPPPPSAKRSLTANGLDNSWDRRLSRGAVEPDITIDLHGMGLEVAYGRLVGGIGQALAMGARVVLLIAGRHRPHGDHDARGERRGAIRAKLLDWLAASPHADRIAAVRPAQQRHGGAGAVYILLRRSR